MIGERRYECRHRVHAIVGYINKLKGFPGVFGYISFAADKHDGYPDDEV